ncbi:hypothetical protein [Salmonella enterica]|uniref:hypothetical protein n=1 Tax=Salmonella enterica TaxID=28901 RepID=UPI00398C6B96
MIRHLSFAIAPPTLPVADRPSPLQAHHMSLVNTLSAMRTQDCTPPAIVRRLPLQSFPPQLAFRLRARSSLAKGSRRGRPDLGRKVRGEGKRGMEGLKERAKTRGFDGREGVEVETGGARSQWARKRDVTDGKLRRIKS